MKALFGVVSLLIALAIVGLVAVKQLKAVGKAGSPASAQLPDIAAAPQLSGSGSLPEQSRELQKRVADDAVKAMSQGVAARKDDADKP